MREPFTESRESSYPYDQFLKDIEVIFAQAPAPKSKPVVFRFFGPGVPPRQVVVWPDGRIFEDGKLLPPKDVAYKFWKEYGQV